MPTLILTNTVPCYFKKLDTSKIAHDFGFLMKQVGFSQGDNFRFRIIDDDSPILKNDRLNGYKLEKMSDYLFESIKGEIRTSEYARSQPR